MFCTEEIQSGASQFEAIAFLPVPALCVPVALRHFTLRPAVIFSISELSHPSPGPSEKVFSFPQLWCLSHGCSPSSSLFATALPLCHHLSLLWNLSWALQNFFPLLHDQLAPRGENPASSKGLHLLLTIYCHASRLSFLSKQQSNIMLEANKNSVSLVVDQRVKAKDCLFLCYTQRSGSNQFSSERFSLKIWTAK